MQYKKLKYFKSSFFQIYIVFEIFILWMWSFVEGGYLEDNYPKSIREDANLDIVQLIQKYKYPVETHFVTTKDKYILRMHRIPKPKAPPVFLMHGLMDSSSTWILMGPNKAPGYFLYENGYDVWMGNARGNRYSRNHTTLNPNKDQEFWRFSWHEIGFYDLPAMIDNVLSQTGFKKTAYFGHSQGTTSFWVLCSMHPEYNEKITMMHALAPVCYMKHLKAPLLGLAKNFAKSLNGRILEFLPHSKMFYHLCLSSKIMESTCLEVLYQILGKDDKHFNMTMLPLILGHIPAGCNFKQVKHYLQLNKNNRFCNYDYGVAENLKRYNHSTPPEYPLEKITVPVGLYYTYNDYLSSEVDVKRLAKILPNVVENTLYPHKKWNHMTMMWGIDARELAHKRMLEVMKNYPYE